MGLGCKIAGMKYDLEHRYPIIMRLERRMCTVEWELNKNNPCFAGKPRRDCEHCDAYFHVEECCHNRDADFCREDCYKKDCCHY